MKRIFFCLLLTAFLTPVLLFAQDEPLDCCVLNRDVTVEGTTYAEGRTVGRDSSCSLTGRNTDYVTKKWTLICLLGSVILVTDWIFIFLMIFVSLMVIIGAYTIVSAAGLPDRVTKGKNYILYAVIGMVVGLLSKGIPDLIEVLLGI